MHEGMQSTAGLTIEEEQYYYCNVYLSNNHLMWRLDPIFNLYCLHFNLIIISLLILCFFLAFFWGGVFWSVYHYWHHQCHCCQWSTLFIASKSLDYSKITVLVFIVQLSLCFRSALSPFKWSHHKQQHILCDTFLQTWHNSLPWPLLSRLLVPLPHQSPQK